MDPPLLRARARMRVLAGGRSLNDLFRFDLSSSEWAPVRVSGVPPSPRGGHTAVVHCSTMYAFGGKSGRSPFNDLHAFSFETHRWEAVKIGHTAPAPRCAHTCVVYGSSLFVFGGYDGRRYFDDCFELALQKPAAAAVLSLSGDLESMVDNPQFSVHAADLSTEPVCGRHAPLMPHHRVPHASPGRGIHR